MHLKLFYFLFISFICSPAVATPSSYILFFQPLYELPENLSQDYLKEVRETLAANSPSEIDRLIARSYQNDTCSKKNLRTCVHGLYSFQVCVDPKQKNISQKCLKGSKAKTSDFFHESVFNRLNWNQFALQLSLNCQKKQSLTCKKLSQIHEKYYLKFKQHRSQKIKKMKLRKEWDL